MCEWVKCKSVIPSGLYMCQNGKCISRDESCKARTTIPCLNRRAMLGYKLIFLANLPQYCIIPVHGSLHCPYCENLHSQNHPLDHP